MKKTEIDYNGEKIIIESEYLGNKQWPQDPINRNNHQITLSFKEDSLIFEYWGTLLEPKITNDLQNVKAFRSFLADITAGKKIFEDFCNTFGYDTDDPLSKKDWSECRKLSVDFDKMFDNVYEILNFLIDNYEV